MPISITASVEDFTSSAQAAFHHATNAVGESDRPTQALLVLEELIRKRLETEFKKPAQLVVLEKRRQAAKAELKGTAELLSQMVPSAQRQALAMAILEAARCASALDSQRSRRIS